MYCKSIQILSQCRAPSQFLPYTRSTFPLPLLVIGVFVFLVVVLFVVFTVVVVVVVFL